MPNRRDLYGQKFGMLTAIKPDMYPERRTYWQCLCECGQITSVETSNLRSGKVRSCGCLRSIAGDAKSINIPPGTRVGKLTVISRAENGQNGSRRYNCLCDCGNMVTNLTTRLNKNKVQSCGCLKHEMSRTRIKKNPIHKSGTDNSRWNGFGELSGSHWNSIKTGAKNRNLEFSITIQEAWDLFVSQRGLCRLSGISLTHRSGICRRRDSGTASLDRIDSKKGYTVDNIQWVHKIINMMKQALSDDQFIYYCKMIARHQSTEENYAAQEEV